MENAATLVIKKFLSGYYRIEAPLGYGNVKLSRGPEHKGKWLADIHNNSGDLVCYAGIWKTKKDAVEEVTNILTREFS